MHRFRTEPMFKELLGFVSHKALDLLINELSNISNIGLTIDNCEQVNGLPCVHMLVDFRHTEGFIPLSVIDSYWKHLSCTPPTLPRSTLDFLDLPKIKALQSRYGESPDNVRLVTQQDLRLLAFPQTTIILEPTWQLSKKVDLLEKISQLNEILLILNMLKRPCPVAQILLRLVIT